MVHKAASHLGVASRGALVEAEVDVVASGRERLILPRQDFWTPLSVPIIDWGRKFSSVTEMVPPFQSARFTCAPVDSADLTTFGSFASQPPLSQGPIRGRWKAPSPDAVQQDGQARRKLDGLLSVLQLLMFLQSCSGRLLDSPPASPHVLRGVFKAFWGTYPLLW